MTAYEMRISDWISDVCSSDLSNEIVAINLVAHLDTDIVLVVDIPGTGVADDLPILGLCDHRPGPKGFGQRRKSQRAVKTFTGFHHFQGIIALCDKQVANVIS